jgi:hypothetical protein
LQIEFASSPAIGNLERKKEMTEHEGMDGLLRAVRKYFDLMYDCDVSAFDHVFRPTSQLHGFRDGEMSMWSAGTYKDILSKRQSPKSQGSPREEQVLMMDFASPNQALVKVRVRIGATVFVDYLTYHRFETDWLITSKAYHVEGSKV